MLQIHGGISNLSATNERDYEIPYPLLEMLQGLQSIENAIYIRMPDIYRKCTPEQ